MDGKRKLLRRAAASACIAVTPVALLPLRASAATVDHHPVDVIVRATAGHLDGAHRLVVALGGRVTLDLDIIGGFAADVPADRLAALRASSDVSEVTEDARVHMNDSGTTTTATSTDPYQQTGSLYNVARMINADDAWNVGVTGQGVDVAVIDTGVAPVPGLAGRYVNGPDLSLDAMGPGTAGLDAFGHGTAMASIIAGRDPLAPSDPTKLDNVANKEFIGIAPGSRVVNVKVGAFDGGSDVSQVIAAIDWVVQHAHDGGRNIRVVNLSFGTDGVQDYMLDPLTYATEVAWRKGIVVVVSAGNTGVGTSKLNDPAYDPYVMAVGADDMNGTVATGDDIIADFSSRGDAARRPDFVAPGVGIVGLRDPGSFLDTMYPAARQGDRFFRGSGTSQAAAVVSGASALLLSAAPQLTPDQVKAALAQSGMPLKTSAGTTLDNGGRLVNVTGALGRASSMLRYGLRYPQTWPLATGTGSIEGSRGSFHLTDANGNTLRGEVDLFGHAWDGSTWSANAWNGSTWSGDSWNGSTWSSNLWNGSTWSGDLWSGRSWSGSTWSGSTWSGSTWSGSTWSGSTWSGSTWSGSTWSGSTWSGSTWSGSTWSGDDWS